MELKREEMNLWQKVNEIQNGAMEVVKGGKNNFAKYNYKTFTNIKEAVVKKMHDLGVVFLPAFIREDYDLDMLRLKIEKDGKATQVSYIQCFELINADKPDERQKFIFPMIGTNNDGADKANGSATTYGLKYLFNTWGLIPDESLDPDTRGEIQKEDKKENKQVNKWLNKEISYSADMLKILQEVASKSELGQLLKQRIQDMTGKEAPSKADILNGVQADENRMKELKELMWGNK